MITESNSCFCRNFPRVIEALRDAPITVNIRHGTRGGNDEIAVAD